MALAVYTSDRRVAITENESSIDRKPGIYAVYIGNGSAGSFTFAGPADHSIVLYVSIALSFIAIVAGTAISLRREHSDFHFSPCRHHSNVKGIQGLP